MVFMVHKLGFSEMLGYYKCLVLSSEVEVILICVESLLMIVREELDKA